MTQNAQDQPRGEPAASPQEMPASAASPGSGTAPSSGAKYTVESGPAFVTMPAWFPHRVYIENEMTPEDRLWPTTMKVQCYRCDMFATLWTGDSKAIRIKAILCDRCKESVKRGIKDGAVFDA